MLQGLRSAKKVQAVILRFSEELDSVAYRTTELIGPDTKEEIEREFRKLNEKTEKEFECENEGTWAYDGKVELVEIKGIRSWNSGDYVVDARSMIFPNFFLNRHCEA